MTFLDVIRSGKKKDLAGANLRGANLAGADLTKANLAGADLTKANLSQAGLIEANLSQANLAEAKLTGADLTRANLAGSRLTCASLVGAGLVGADLTKAKLTGADLSRANLSQTKGLKIPNILSSLEQTKTGFIAYKFFNGWYHSPAEWKICDNSVIMENVCTDITIECACGINVSTLEWQEYHSNLWVVEVPFTAQIVVPLNSDGKFRVNTCKILRKFMK